MELIYGSTKEKFIPHTVMSFPNIRKVKLLMENDSFSKYEAITEVKGEYIVCNDITKLKKYSKTLVKESYEDYVEFIKNRDYEKIDFLFDDGEIKWNKLGYMVYDPDFRYKLTGETVDPRAWKPEKNRDRKDIKSRLGYSRIGLRNV